MPDMEVELLAAALRQDSADLNLYAEVLSANLVDSLPPGAVRIKRRRSVTDRLAGREGSVAELDVTLGEQRLSLRMEGAGSPGRSATRCGASCSRGAERTWGSGSRLWPGPWPRPLPPTPVPARPSGASWPDHRRPAPRGAAGRGGRPGSGSASLPWRG
ncbi:hypothetical protein ACFQ0M_02980 [Kitasatospora aburaviensis]